jgi:hypothetical protein
MKIIHHTPTQLILRHRPFIFWLLGSFLTIVGVVIIILFSKTSTLICERGLSNQGHCELKHSHFFISKQIVFSIKDLKEVRVVKSYSRWMIGVQEPEYRVILITATEKIALTPYGTTERAQQDAMAAKINGFLQHVNITTLAIEQDNRWLIFLIGGIFILIGLLAELSQIVTVTFDKEVGSFKIERQSLLGAKVIEYSLEDIIDVKVKISSYFNSKTMLYQVIMEIIPNETILLTSNNSIGKARKQKIVDEIRQFIS